MKKVISLLLVLCCVVSAFSFSAYAKYDKEILFRDIPWGSNYTDVIDALKDLNVEWNSITKIGYRTTMDIMVDWYKDEETDYRTISLVDTKKANEKIAGLPIKSIALYFTNKDTTSLFMAEYEFDTSNMNDSALDELFNKLAELYGAPDKNSAAFPSVDIYDYAIIPYLGKNNTTVYLVWGDPKLDRDSKVSLFYVDGNGEKMAKSHMEELKSERASDKNGL